MATLTTHTAPEKSVDELVAYYQSLTSMINGITYTFCDVVSNALLVALPPLALVGYALTAENRVPKLAYGYVEIDSAENLFCSSVPEEIAANRAAVIRMLQKVLATVPKERWPTFAITEEAGYNAYYSYSDNSITFGVYLIDDLELSHDALEFIAAHELGHYVNKHVEKYVDAMCAKYFWLGALGALNIAIPALFWPTVGIASAYDFYQHSLSRSAEFEADAFAVTSTKSVKGIEDFCERLHQLGGTVYYRFLREGYSEKDAKRLATACESGYFTHPSHWERVLAAHEQLKQITANQG